MYRAFFCGDGFHGLDGIYKPASSDNSRVRGENVGNCRRHSPALLSVNRSRDVSDACRCSGDAARVSPGGAHFFTGVADGYTRGPAGGGRLGSFADIPFTNFEPGVDLCVVAGLRPVPISGELHHLSDHAQDMLAWRFQRAGCARTDAHSLLLRRRIDAAPRLSIVDLEKISTARQGRNQMQKPLPLSIACCSSARTPYLGRATNAMQEFIAQHTEEIAGVLSGFDQLVFQGTPRSISWAEGMMGYRSLALLFRP